MAKKDGKPIKKYVHFTRDVKDFVLEKMHEGMSILEISHKYPDKVPHADKIYKASLKDDVFKNEVDDAYAVILMRKLDELNRVGTLPASQLFPDLDWREGEATVKRQIDTLKFTLGKMAPVLSKRFQRTDKLEVSGIEGSSVAIINYYADSPSTTTTVSVDNKMINKEPLKALIEG